MITRYKVALTKNLTQSYFYGHKIFRAEGCEEWLKKGLFRACFDGKRNPLGRAPGAGPSAWPTP